MCTEQVLHWTGTESVEERSKILDIYRGLDNKFGQVCLMLFTTQSGAEGISLNYETSPCIGT